MLTETERTRFNLLRDREARGETLSAAEAAEVAGLIQRIEAAETLYLAPATEKLRRDNEASQKRLRALNALIEREERYLSRVQATLAELHAEREAIATEK